MCVCNECNCRVSNSSADIYVKVMKKIVERGAEYVKTETDRLGRMLSESTPLYYGRSSFSLVCRWCY